MASISIPKSLFVLILITISMSPEAQATRRKQTNLAFYMHDIVAGAGDTALTVAGVNGSNSNVLSYGTVTVIDHVLTQGPNRRSKEIGRAQGIYVGSATRGLSLHLVFSVVFTDGEYSGSTLEIQGANRLALRQREVSVVSGTRAFRFCKGFALIERAAFDPRTLNAVLKFNITVRHF